MGNKQASIVKTETPEEWKVLSISKLRSTVFEHIRKEYGGLTIVNRDLNIPVTISVKSCRKTAYGEAMYIKKAAASLVLPELIENATYNNFGNRKESDPPTVIGYLNFKCKCLIDGKKECLRISVQFQKGGKFYYNIEVNKKVRAT